MVGVGKRLPDRHRVSLIASQKSAYATKAIKQLAKNNDAMILVSVSEGGINAID